MCVFAMHGSKEDVRMALPVVSEPSRRSPPQGLTVAGARGPKGQLHAANVTPSEKHPITPQGKGQSGKGPTKNESRPSRPLSYPPSIIPRWAHLLFPAATGEMCRWRWPVQMITSIPISAHPPLVL